MKIKLSRIIKLSLVFTLPINIFFWLWFFQTTHIYNNLEKFNITLPKGERLKNVSDAVISDLIYQLYHLIGINKHSDINLILKQKYIDELSQNPPMTGSEYKPDALLVIDNTVLKGKAKFRGDFFYHWSFPRRSWRFKASKQNIYKNTRKFNFIIPKSESLISNLTSYEIAKDLNLMTPDSRLVDFSVNGRYKGVRLMTNQIDENFLRSNNRMPSDIYKGDNIGIKQVKGVYASLFNNPSIWEKHSFNNHYAKENKRPLTLIMKELNENIYDHLDLKSFASMSALIDISSSYHFDNRHNWILYYDNYYEKLFPIIWDVFGWFPPNIQKNNINIITSDLFFKLYHNYDFIRLKNNNLIKFYQNKEEIVKKSLIKFLGQAKEFIHRNGHSFSLGRQLISEKKALMSINEFEINVYNQLNKIKNKFIGNISAKDYKYALINNKLRLFISGNKEIKGIKINLINKQQLKQVFLSFKQSNQLSTINLLDKTKKNGNEILIDISLLANAKFENITQGNKVVFKEATYDLELIGISDENIGDVNLVFNNLKQETHRVKRVKHIKQVSFDASLQNIITKTKNTKILNWSGEKYFKGLIVIEKNIIIEKGTKLIFDEGATLKVLGSITAIATKDEPIIFQALDSTKPWGALVLKDEGANGSKFQHVIFKNGSGNKGDLYEYTGMISVHNVKNLLIQDSSFYDSKITDDMVHLVYSEVKIKNTQFVGSFSDALDVDISNVLIDDCTFINAGNDSIDLMTSNAIVINSKFKHSSDKAISVGEDSKLLAINNLIESNSIGIQSKDNSKANIYNTNFINNNKALDAYHKNWRYTDGGTINISDSIFENNLENATVGKKSAITLSNCKIDTPNNFDLEHIRNNKITINKKHLTQYQFKDPMFIKYKSLIHNETKGVHE